MSNRETDTGSALAAALRDAAGKPATQFIEVPEDVVLTNGGVRCDLLSGPCACGAWHRVRMDGTRE